jgi:hypothetical protein
MWNFITFGEQEILPMMRLCASNSGKDPNRDCQRPANGAHGPNRTESEGLGKQPQ